MLPPPPRLQVSRLPHIWPPVPGLGLLGLRRFGASGHPVDLSLVHHHGRGQRQGPASATLHHLHQVLSGVPAERHACGVRVWTRGGDGVRAQVPPLRLLGEERWTGPRGLYRRPETQLTRAPVLIYSIVPRLWIYYLYDKFVVKTFRRLTWLDIKGFVQFTMERLFSHVALICLGVGHSYYYFILLFIKFVRMVLILRFLKCDMVK